jgi:hypothetical protein
MSLLSVGLPHELPLAVNVSVAVPLYPAGGVHVAFNVVALGLNVPPDDDDHVPPVALPPTEPPSAADDPPWQIAVNAEPAFTVGTEITVAFTAVLEEDIQPVLVFLASA